MDRFEQLPNMACEVTPELKQRIADVNREAIALHIGCLPTVFVGAKVTDEFGNVTSDKMYKANSFNRNFYNYFCAWFMGITSDTAVFGEGYLNYKATTGTIYAADKGYKYGFSSDQTPAGTPLLAAGTYGILCGIGNDAESFDGYKLSSIVTSGTTSGKMTYVTAVYESGIYDSATKKWITIYSRIFKNTSGASIAVTETGLYGKLDGSYVDMYERTLFPSAIEVPNGSQIEVTYTFEFVFPEPAA